MGFSCLCIQLREDFDAGKDVKFNEENCPHDVATLLKEFFRDLPDPLLTRDLYPAFLQTQSEYIHIHFHNFISPEKYLTSRFNFLLFGHSYLNSDIKALGST